MYELLSYLNRIHPVSPELKKYLGAVMKQKRIPKHQYLVEAGETGNKIWFLEKGLIRCYYTQDEREITVWFINEGNFIFPYDSLLDQKPNQFYLETLENCIVWHLSHTDIKYITEQFPEVTIFKTKITQWHAHLLHLRLQCTSMQTAKERYRFFMQHFPYLNKRIKHTTLASYLDISKRTLIRLLHN